MAPLVSGRAVAPRAVTTAAAAGVALMLAAAPALASITAMTNGVDTVTVTSTGTADVVTVSCVGDETDVNGTSPLPVLACQDVAFVDVVAGGGADTVNLGGVTLLAFPALSQTSIDVDDSSADSVTGSEGRDVVRADFHDVSVSTGAGDDWVEGAGIASGGDGDDTLRQISDSVQGGAGNDLIVGTPTVLIDGGTGFDTDVVDYSAFTSQVSVSLAITDTSINGSTATSSIEQYDITSSDGAKADGIDSRLYSGRISFHSRAGDDTFLGGPGADLADLGPGNDVADPGPGADFVLAGDGDDTIAVRDGFGDVVECGAGNDTVTADRVDVLSGCESVALPPPETSRIDGPKKVIKGPKVSFVFAASVAGATFECQLDTGRVKACASPFKVRTRRLKTGKHTLTVRAVQPAGNADPTPSSFTFRVKTKKGSELRRSGRSARAR